MIRIGIRELRQHASRYLGMVKAGDTVEVTDRGVLVALLVPPSPDQSARQRLIAAGTVQPAAGPARLPSRRRVVSRTQQALDDVRNDRL